LKELPPGCRLGDNANAFEGGFRLWQSAKASAGSRPKPVNRGSPA
jgi:polyphosphate glucokinase